MSEQPLSERIRYLAPFGVSSKRMLNDWANEVAQLEAENERLREGISKVIVESMSKETSIAWLRIMLNDILEPADE